MVDFIRNCRVSSGSAYSLEGPANVCLLFSCSKHAILHRHVKILEKQNLVISCKVIKNIGFYVKLIKIGSIQEIQKLVLSSKNINNKIPSLNPISHSLQRCTVSCSIICTHSFISQRDLKL